MPSLKPNPLYDELRHRLDIGAIIGRDIDLRQVGNELHGLCPFHKEKTPSFQVIPAKSFYHCQGCEAHGDAIDWLEKFRGQSHRDAVQELSESVGMVGGTEERPGKVGSHAELWRRSTPPGAYVIAYLRSRGFEMTTPPGILRQIEALTHVDGQNRRHQYPAIIAPVIKELGTPGASLDPVAVHRIYLAANGAGKAPVDTAKKALGSIAGGFIPLLIRDEPELSLTEGIEDAIAVGLSVGGSVWATISSGNMHKVVGAIPANVRTLRIFADNDTAGRKAAEETVAAWRKLRGPAANVVVVYPPEGTKDVNDLYVAGGAQAVKGALEAAVEVEAEEGAPKLENAATWLKSKNALKMPSPLISKFLDAGSKLMIAGASKAGKSFFSLQLAQSMAGGRSEFCGLEIVGKSRVLMIQPEIHEAHYQSRCRNAFHGLFGINADPEEVFSDRLAIRNCRGDNHLSMLQAGEIIDLAVSHQADVVFIDPLYKFLETGKEDSEDFRGFLMAIDRIAEASGAAVAYVHHYGKGNTTDRSALDRGSGSGYLARDIDAGIFLGDHQRANDEENEGLLVLECRNRNYAKIQPVSIKQDWLKGHFVTVDTPAELKQVMQRRPRVEKPAIIPAEAIALFNGKLPMSAADARDLIGTLGTQKDARALYRKFIADQLLEELPREKVTDPKLVQRSRDGF